MVVLYFLWLRVILYIEVYFEKILVQTSFRLELTWLKISLKCAGSYFDDNLKTNQGMKFRKKEISRTDLRFRQNCSWEPKPGWEQDTGEKTERWRGRLKRFPQLNWSHPSVLDFLHLCLLCCSYSSEIVRIKSCKSCEHQPSLLTSGLHSNWRWNRHYRVKLGSKQRVWCL
jgi:hypothetical protein